jgi:hypothetical protein
MRNVKNQISKPLWEQVRDKARNKMNDQVWIQVRDQVREHVSDQVGNQSRAPLGYQVWTQLLQNMNL